jgi:hypothetical protein
MEELTDMTKYTFFKLFDGVLSVENFEQWIYKSDKDLERELEYDLYFSLISFNYSQKDALAKLKSCILPYVDISEFNIWQIKNILTDIIEERIDQVLATRILRKLYFDTGENFIPITLGVGYESVLDEVPIPSEYGKWSSNELKEKLKIVAHYRADLINDARSFLEQLNSGKNSYEKL